MKIDLIEFRLHVAKTIYHLYIQERHISKELLGNLVRKTQGGYVVNPPKPYKIRVDRARDPNSQDHIHIFIDGGEIAINRDGTTRHKKGKIRIPKKIWYFLRKHFPDYPFPIPVFDIALIKQDTISRSYEVIFFKDNMYSFVQLFKTHDSMK